MHSVIQMIDQDYHFGAPTQEAEDIDAQVAEGLKCRKCGERVRYEGYHRQPGPDRDIEKVWSSWAVRPCQGPAGP